MTRRTAVLTLTGLLLAGGAVSPSLAGADDGRSTTCLLLEPESGEREGFCVWVPLPGDGR